MEPWNLLPQSIASVVELFRRPKGYYEPNLWLPVCLDQAGASFSAVFRHRYKGPFQLGLQMEKPIVPPERFCDWGVKTFDWGGRFRLTLEAPGQRIVRDVGENPKLWLADQHTQGFSFLEYLVPYDLPFRGEIRVELLVLDAGRGLPAAYRAPHLYVRRRSYYLYRYQPPDRT